MPIRDRCPFENFFCQGLSLLTGTAADDPHVQKCGPHCQDGEQEADQPVEQISRSFEVGGKPGASPCQHCRRSNQEKQPYPASAFVDGALNQWPHSSIELVDQLSVHIGESKISSLKAKGQTLVVQPKEMKDRGVNVMGMSRIADGIKAQFVGFTDDMSRLGATACKPHGKGIDVVIGWEQCGCLCLVVWLVGHR